MPNVTLIGKYCHPDWAKTANLSNITIIGGSCKSVPTPSVCWKICKSGPMAQSLMPNVTLIGKYCHPDWAKTANISNITKTCKPVPTPSQIGGKYGPVV